MKATVRPLTESDLPEAERIYRLAFGTQLGVDEPENYALDRDFIRARFAARPDAAFALEIGSKLRGSIFAVCWGEVAFFGPLTIHPDNWGDGLAKLLIEPALARFSAWGVRHAGLFTFSNSPKHLALYQSLGFRPQGLSVFFGRAPAHCETPQNIALFSALQDHEREYMLESSRVLTRTIFPGLDLSLEIQALQNRSMGETLFLINSHGLAGLALCHVGPNTEAGKDAMFIKFACARPGPDSETTFHDLLAACEGLAGSKKLDRLGFVANTNRSAAYEWLLKEKYHMDRVGLSMAKPENTGYYRPNLHCLEDLR